MWPHRPLFRLADVSRSLPFQEKKEWNGLVRALMDEKADMSLASLSITPERNQMIDFSVPFLETGITIIVAVRDGVISPTAFLGEAPNYIILQSPSPKQPDKRAD